jgi:hypothetical protein
MGHSERRAVRHMKAPASGIFQVTGFYKKRSHHMITGVITADGIPATPAEVRADLEGRWVGNNELPAVVDTADPSSFVILWEQVDSISWQTQEMEAAQRLADQLNAGPWRAPGAAAPFPPAGVPGAGFGGGFDFVSSVTIGPDGQPSAVPMPPEAAAQLAQALRQAFAGFTPAEAAQMVSSQAGERGTAVVLGAWDVPAQPGLPEPPGGRSDILLEVTRADGGTYQTRTVIAFATPERKAAIAAVGARHGVWIDPDNPAWVAIDPSGVR